MNQESSIQQSTLKVIPTINAVAQDDKNLIIMEEVVVQTLLMVMEARLDMDVEEAEGVTRGIIINSSIIFVVS